jgi:hypothetical protein
MDSWIAREDEGYKFSKRKEVDKMETCNGNIVCEQRLTAIETTLQYMAKEQTELREDIKEWKTLLLEKDKRAKDLQIKLMIAVISAIISGGLGFAGFILR